MKRDDQMWFNRQAIELQKKQKEEKESAKAKEEADEERDESDEEEEVVGSKIVVLHPGSRNLRVGLASQAFPKTFPMVVAHRSQTPIERKLEPLREEDAAFEKAYKTVTKDLRERMRFYKRRIVPNSHETVSTFNARAQPEVIPDHNDPDRPEYTDTESKPQVLTGREALMIPDVENYDLKWPIKHGAFNEADYASVQELLGDVARILLIALESTLEIDFKKIRNYNAVLVIPDLYDKTYVVSMLELLLGLGFANVAIIQEAIAATFGAGISTACIVDVGAQKTSVTCVDEGMCIADSRVRVPFGGDDITTALVRLFLRSNFPYKDIDLSYSYDWTLAESLKHKFATANDENVAIQLYSFYQRAPNKGGARKYEFKTFDEVMLPILGLFYPEMFQLKDKFASRYRLLPRSVDIYDQKLNDPISDAQLNVAKGTLTVWGGSYLKGTAADPSAASGAQTGVDGTPMSSQPGTPAPSGTGDTAGGAVQTKTMAANQHQAAMQVQYETFESIDATEPVTVGLDHAIIESINQAAAKSGSSKQVFYENIMVVGGGAGLFSGFAHLLSDRLTMWRDSGDGAAPTPGDVAIMPVPREIDPQLISWKGGAVFAKLKVVNEVWISPADWELFGSRTLQYKALFAY